MLIDKKKFLIRFEKRKNTKKLSLFNRSVWVNKNHGNVISIAYLVEILNKK